MPKNINHISEDERRKMMMEDLLEEQHDRMGQYRMINPKASLISNAERQGKKCKICNTKLSVKYQTILNGEAVYLCNKCITKV